MILYLQLRGYYYVGGVYDGGGRATAFEQPQREGRLMGAATLDQGMWGFCNGYRERGKYSILDTKEHLPEKTHPILVRRCSLKELRLMYNILA